MRLGRATVCPRSHSQEERGLSRGLSVGEVFTVGGQGDGTHTEGCWKAGKIQTIPVFSVGAPRFSCQVKD